MESIISEEGATFKDLEQFIFESICLIGREWTKSILKEKDEEIFKTRDAAVYKSEGFRTTSIKTIYGDVMYSRRLYKNVHEDGSTEYVYLLDRELRVEKIGLISENLAGMIAEQAADAPYRKAAERINENTGAFISPQGAWGLIQSIGERVVKEEEHDVNQMETGRGEGKKVCQLLLEEMDGVWIRQQGAHHEKKPMQEVKAATIYEGWDAQMEAQGRSTLVGKHVIAGIEDSKTFHDKREAQIRKYYDADEITHRIVNGDGGSWIKEPNDPDAIIQLDPFHIHKEIRRLIADKEAQKAIEELHAKKDIDGMLEYIQIYADSVASNDSSDKRTKNALALLKYLSNNKDALIPWLERGLDIPEPPAGVIYKDMGVQENQNCTLITLRMKHRRMRWGKRGGNNMVKVLYRRENHELHETINRYSNKLKFADIEIIEILSAAQAAKKDGRGSHYLDILNAHMPLIEAKITEGRKAIVGLSM